ncbi:YbaK/EbsC family protein [Candidatus Shapirobacteria bacterium]|nr:YbaK/EbsC family protein [Candidatus Shapirobacteria bacterium]
MVNEPRTLREKVKMLIASGEIEAEIIDHSGGDALTSEDAAKTHGVPLTQIIKVLLFIDKNGSKAIAILQGNKRVDTKKIPGLRKPRIASAAEIAEILNTEPGGIAPVGLPPEIPKFIDKEVIQEKSVIGSGGDRYTGLKFDPRLIISQPNTQVLDLSE